jgi:heat shock protein HtpX
MFGGSGRDREEGGQIGGILVLVGIVLMILSPIIATLIQLAISRKREYLADASGALLTRYPEGLASALEKIGAHSGKMKRANQATAHLFISNPFGATVQNLFSTHPPIEKRIEALRKSI